MKKQSGFTLIELMIVIAIIGIIAAVVAGAISEPSHSENVSYVPAVSTTAEPKVECIIGKSYIVTGDGAKPVMDSAGNQVSC